MNIKRRGIDLENKIFFSNHSWQMNTKPATERLGHHSFSLYLLRMSGVQAANTNVHTLNASYILISFVELNIFLSKNGFLSCHKISPRDKRIWTVSLLSSQGHTAAKGRQHFWFSACRQRRAEEIGKKKLSFLDTAGVLQLATHLCALVPRANSRHLLVVSR